MALGRFQAFKRVGEDGDRTASPLIGWGGFFIPLGGVGFVGEKIDHHRHGALPLHISNKLYLFNYPTNSRSLFTLFY